MQRVVFRNVLTFICDFYCPLDGCAVQTPVLLAFFCVIAPSTASQALSPVDPVTTPQSAAAAVALVSARLPAQTPSEVPKKPLLAPRIPYDFVALTHTGDTLFCTILHPTGLSSRQHQTVENKTAHFASGGYFSVYL